MEGPLGTETICQLAKPKGVPVIVDAAAERLTVPNLHLGRGADMVALQRRQVPAGDRSAQGLLLGRKDLLQAAWLNSAPHHAFGRSLKVGKEEIMGMLAAVETWGQARSRRRMEDLGGVAERNRQSGHSRRGRDHPDPAAAGPFQPRAAARNPLGRRQTRHHRPGSGEAPARRRSAGHPLLRARQPAHDLERHRHHALHDDAGRFPDRRPSASTRCSPSPPKSRCRRLPRAPPKRLAGSGKCI